jgi:hypothetical protein
VVTKIGPIGARALATTPRLPALATLNLRYNGLDAEIARDLVRSAPATRRIEL